MRWRANEAGLARPSKRLANDTGGPRHEGHEEPAGHDLGRSRATLPPGGGPGGWPAQRRGCDSAGPQRLVRPPWRQQGDDRPSCRHTRDCVVGWAMTMSIATARARPSSRGPNQRERCDQQQRPMKPPAHPAVVTRRGHGCRYRARTTGHTPMAPAGIGTISAHSDPVVRDQLGLRVLGRLRLLRRRRRISCHRHQGTRQWDGGVLGWEPRGGAAGECEADDADIKNCLFFYDAVDTGEESSARGLLPSRQESVEDDSALGGRRRTARLGPRFQDTRGTFGVVAMPRASSTVGQVRLNGG
jgi:hypothetical protein